MAKAKKKAKSAKAQRPVARAAKRRVAPKKVSYKPARVSAVTPTLAVHDCAAAIEFWKQAFGAKERSRMPAPDGTKIWHAELRIDDSTVFAQDAMEPEAGTGNTSMMLYVRDSDAVFERAVQAGAQVEMPLTDAFWGDRYGMVKDPFGVRWAIATHQEDVRPAALKKRGEEFARTRGQTQTD